MKEMNRTHEKVFHSMPKEVLAIIKWDILNNQQF